MAKAAKAKKRRFNSPVHVKRFLADILNRLDADLLSEGKAHQLGYLCKILAELMQDTDIAAAFEERIANLERKAGIIT